jgi:hypothetical protein
MPIGDDRLHMMSSSSSFPSILSFNCQVCNVRCVFNGFEVIELYLNSIGLSILLSNLCDYPIVWWWWCYYCRVKRSSKNINNFHRSENCICFVCQFVPIEFVQAVYCVMQIYPISQFVIVDQLVILFSSSPIGKV